MKKPEPSPPQVWFIGDTHFFHTNLRLPEYEDRPDDCDGRMMQNLYRCVGEDDTLVHLGDVLIHLRAAAARNFVGALPGARRILIEGNHDKSARIRTSKHWNLVVRYGQIWNGSTEFPEAEEFNIDGIRLAVSHCPETMEDVDADIVIHGHVHSAFSRFNWNDNVLWVNGCVEVWDYCPFSWQQVLNEYLKVREIPKDMLDEPS